MATPAILGIQELGQGIPPDTQHAISVSLPTWQLSVDYRAGKQEAKEAVKAGYPRIFIHSNIMQLEAICLQRFGAGGEKCTLTPSKKAAEQSEAFIRHQAAPALGIAATTKHVQYTIEDSSSLKRPCTELHIVFYPEDFRPYADEFWRCTGLGISSRFADYCLNLLSDEVGVSEKWGSVNQQPDTAASRDASKKEQEISVGVSQSSNAIVPRVVSKKGQTTHVEEGSREDSNLSSLVAKEVLRKRIARAIATGKVDDSLKGPCIDTEDVETGHNGGGVVDVSEEDVFLYPNGMATVLNAHSLCSQARPSAKSVVFGMPYIDTLTLLEKWGPGVYFYGFGHDSDMEALERLLAEEFNKDPTKPPILALFTEFPSNPLLRSADLPRLRALADTYDFLLVIDETLGNFVNTDILPYADIIITSLTKVFSGAADVMGGSLVLNPKGRHYTTLVIKMADYEDVYYDEDAVVMERNSRDMVRRVRIIDANTEALCAYLRERSVAGGAPSAVIKDVFYPKYTDTVHYLRCKRPRGGFGGLFSLTFKTLEASKAFFDTLPCYKGPTLGTNFTLASPYTILALPKELAWAERYGMPEELVRVSVGMEDKDLIIRAFEWALKAAESTQQHVL